MSGRNVAAWVGTNPYQIASDGPRYAAPTAPRNLGNHTRLHARLKPALSTLSRSPWGAETRGPGLRPPIAWGLAGLLLVLLMCVPRLAAADRDDVPRTLPPTTFRSSADLDGLYLWVGPGGAATRVEGTWDSAWGGSVQVVRVRERAWLGALGGSFGAAHYAARDGGRLWFEGMVGTRRLVGKMVGMSAGPTLELGERRHARTGAQATIWCFVGVVPFVRAGVLDASGAFVEVGLSLSLPALRF